MQQAYPIDKYPVEEDTEFWLTQKLNGVRATYYKGQLYARSGVPYEGLEHILDVLKIDDADSYVFDGELTLRDKGTLSDNEAFRKAAGIINSENEDIGLGVEQGKIVGKILNVLLDGVISETVENNREALLQKAVEYIE